MTISSTVNRKNYVGNGVTTSFSFPYAVLAAADLKVYKNGTLQTLATHYTLSGTAPYTSGANVQFVSAPASGQSVVILRDPAIRQLVDAVENDPLPVETALERPLDKLTMIAPRLSERLDRAAGLPDTYVGAASAAIPVPGAGYYLRWNAAGTALEAVAAVNDPGSVTIGDYSRSVTSILTDREVCVLDYIPVAEHAGIAARTSTTDLQAYMQAAVDALPANGGTLYFPAGRYMFSGALTMNEGEIQAGAGDQATTLWHIGSGTALKFGDAPSAVKRGMGMRDIGIILTVKTSTALYLTGLVGCHFKNIYIEGPIEAARSNRGIVIGGDASTSLNIFDTITCNHIETGFLSRNWPIANTLKLKRRCQRPRT